MPLTITSCVVDTTSIAITFSEAVDLGTTGTGALNPDNYTVYDPALPGFGVPTNPDSTWNFTPDPNNVQAVILALPTGVSFNPGDFVLVSITNIALAATPGTPALANDPSSFSRVVLGDQDDDTARTTKNVEDAVSYPVLTEEIGYRPSPVGIPAGGGGGTGGGGGGPSNLGQIALRAVSDVLGWKANAADPKGFVGALTQSFTLTDVEGHIESTWTPRTYTVQTDLGGGISGAQASLYTRAKDALDQSLSLLNGLYPLDPEADPEYVKALREMARSQMTEIVREFGAVGLPSILRINTYFDILLKQHDPAVEFNPDKVKGTLGELRDTYGIFFTGNPFNNSIEDEQDITNFRVISDYMTSLLQSWIANRDFFRLGTTNPTFFGTQLVLISRQFNVITETVNEVRFTLDSVFIGPNERQTLLLEFNDSVNFPPMFLEDVLDEVEKFATDEGPRLLRDGGKISVTNNLLPVVDSLASLINQAHEPANAGILPDGYRTARVQKSLDDLEDQLNALITLIQQVEQQVPPAEGKLSVEGIAIDVDDSGNNIILIFGDGFTFETAVTINSTVPTVIPPNQIIFWSAQRIDVSPAPTNLSRGQSHDITVTNPDGESANLFGALIVANNGNLSAARRSKAARPAPPPLSRRRARAGKQRPMLPAGKAPVPTKSAPPATPPAATLAPTPAPPVAPPTVPPPAPTAPSADVSALQNQIQQLQNSHDELKTGHQTIIQKVEGMEERIVKTLTEVFKGKLKED